MKINLDNAKHFFEKSIKFSNPYMQKSKKIGVDFFNIIIQPYYQGVAEQLAFFFLLSIVPIFILLSQILSFFSISMNYFKNTIETYVAPEVASVIISMFQNENTGTMNFIFIVISLWAASKVQFALIRISNHTMSLGEQVQYSYWKERLRAIQAIVLTMLSLTFGLIIMVYGEIILNVIAIFIYNRTGVHFEIHSFWLFLRLPITLLIYFMTVSYNYYTLTSNNIKFKQILPGSMFSALGLLVVTLAYKYYMERMANFDVLYGSMGTIVALIMWFYFLSWVLVIGIILNKVIIDLNKPKNDKKIMDSISIESIELN